MDTLQPAQGLSTSAGAVRLVLRDGAAVTIRPVAPGDKPQVAAFFTGLSLQSRYRRFLWAKPSLSAHDLSRFVDIDHRRNEGSWRSTLPAR